MRLRLMIFVLASVVWGQAAIHPVDGKTHGAIEPDCIRMAQQVAQVINSLPHPANWDYVVYCNDVVWENALRSADNHGTDWAFTSLADHKTYIRATMFRRELPLSVTPQFILAHELGHIFLQSDDEEKANNWAKEHLSK